MKVIVATWASLLAFVSVQAATVQGPVSAVMSSDLPVGTHALSFPLLSEQVFTGSIAGNTVDTLTFSRGGLAALLSSGNKYYVELVSGPHEGERFDLVSANGVDVIVKFGADTASTRTTLAANSLIGAKAVVRRHVTLQGIAAQFAPALTGNNTATLADSVQLYRDGVFTTYYLRADGVTWREVGKTVDERARVVPPDTSILLQLRSAKRWVHAGGVRVNTFRVNLPAGSRAFAAGVPVDLSFTQLGAFIDTTLPEASRWKGSNTSGSADQIQVFTSADGTFRTYYLRADGVSWRQVGSTTNVSAEKLVGARSMLIILRANADGDYFVLPPYNL